MLSVSGLFKSYQDTPVVQDVSFEVNQGERLILLGTSGSGKSTILKMINRLIEIDAGEIKLSGVNISTFKPHLLRRKIGYVIQGIGLFPHYTIAKNIALLPSLLGWTEERIDQRVNELIRLVGLDDHMKDRKPDQLSGGQQQRAGLARALAAEPQLLLMDEPFGALDPITRKEIQQEFLTLENGQPTVVLVTHDVKEAFLLGHKICLLDAGQIQQIGSPKQLLFQPANSFVRHFLKDHFIELELSLVRVHHLLPFAKKVSLEGAAQTIDRNLPVSEAMQMMQILSIDDSGTRVYLKPSEIAAIYFEHRDEIRPDL